MLSICVVAFWGKPAASKADQESGQIRCLSRFFSNRSGLATFTDPESDAACYSYGSGGRAGRAGTLGKSPCLTCTAATLQPSARRMRDASARRHR